ncbi:MAG: hypothetical protein K0R93_1040 [Anaerosolibacter sp.]|jgi:hypothetical protein|uniref:HK97 gp10 family phage protein n=1 Tax=Anaerosolibacter sp. TaxID=1872527 RepID=UPI002637DE52|nr:HK97 gp10 family phage protein [Anaerosolibacter sp.]MDF2546142.1 hypothetical protein [Anaerosolibacter sp.]
MFVIEGLDGFEKTLIDTLEKKYPKEVEKQLIRLAKELKDSVAAKTPVGTEKKTSSKRLKKNWRVGKVRKKGNELFIEVYNKAPHAHLVEDGHRTVDGGFVEGKHMLLISVKQLEQRLTPKLQAWLNQMLKELEL